MAHSHDTFTTETRGLPPAATPGTTRLRNGEVFDLRIFPVANRIGDDVVRMLAYNGSIPGPTLEVDQESEITVNVTNQSEAEATVHWHGLRLENRYDGVPHETQAPIPVGGSFTYKLQFPDAGFYWYHPHMREDFGLEMGLYGTIVVHPADPSYWPPADRHLAITLDDLLMEDGHIAPFNRSGPNYTAMGRFGNVMLTNGKTEFSAEAAVGEVVRLYVVNTANSRIFNFALRGARMKLVGGDSGRYEREAFVEEVLLAPSERAVVDVLFDAPGDVRLEHRTPDRVYDLGSFTVAGSAPGEAATSFDMLRVDAELSAQRRALGMHLEREPDKVLAFSSRMPLLYGGATVSTSSYVCPMHPEVTGTEPGKCPKCGMTLVPVTVAAEAPAPSAAHHGGSHAEAHHGGGDGLEWEDLMPEINRQSDTTNMFWEIIDRETGARNGAITWAFTVGDQVKIRLVNEMESDHPMHHPFHVHGAGRFLVLARDGVPEDNLVWKDTVLVPAGRTVDILLDVSNPGLWMAHCHIAEHAQSGMMFSFDVARAAPAG